MKILYCLFNTCLRENLVPGMWKRAIIHPIPKESGKITDPLKYRGLALQSCILKMFSNVLNDRVTKFLEDMGGISDTQNGFRKNRSCLHHIFSLVTIAKNCIVRQSGKLPNSGLFVGFVDFHKAFDVIDRDLLIHRLAATGVKGPILSVIQQMYKDTRMY